MEQLALSVPGMWADHHVIAVRGLFQQAEDVQVTGASAMDATLRLEYDPAKTDPQRIVAQLEQAGYAAGETPEADAPPTDKPAWLTAGVRVTTTDPADLTMSGDHRKY
ncbi:MAG TPA: heavy-metal-associated domain-containing protein [Thermoleophilia bacterium]|jgi:copper chaperone CopZ|nr:heavy-metal-associated domain-containing protein [Thermoleophilia bacterium]